MTEISKSANRSTPRATNRPATSESETTRDTASATTIGGLTPLLFERSLQAQFLIPMAITIVFGLMVATVLVLVVVLVVIPGTFAALWGTPLLSPGIVGILFMTEISVGTVTAALWAGEPFGLREIVGVLLISGAGLAESLQAPFAWRRTKTGTGPAPRGRQ